MIILLAIASLVAMLSLPFVQAVETVETAATSTKSAFADSGSAREEPVLNYAEVQLL